ncbi:MAG: YkgJ family cysteine cluster protein [Planctomycetota bacterium]
MDDDRNAAASPGKCRTCGGKCCRYVAVEIDKPQTEADFDDIRWYVAHENVSVFIEDGDWYINFDAACRHLTPDNRCAIHNHKPRICTTHSADDCEEGEGESARVELRTPEEVEAFIARRPAAAKMMQFSR